MITRHSDREVDDATILSYALDALHQVFVGVFDKDEGNLLLRDFRVGINAKRIRIGNWGSFAYSKEPTRLRLIVESRTDSGTANKKYHQWTRRFERHLVGRKPPHVKIELRTLPS